MSIPTQLDHLQRTAGRLLQEYRLSLGEAGLGSQDPTSVARRYDPRFRALSREIDSLERAVAPLGDESSAGEFLQFLRQHVSSSRQEALERAKRAHLNQGTLPPGLRRTYQESMGKALAGLPRKGTESLKQQLHGVLQPMVDSVIGLSGVPAQVKTQLTRNLTEWAAKQEPVDAAVYAVQGVLQDVATYLKSRLTLHTDILTVRDSVAKQGKLTPEEAKQAEREVGKLAKHGRQLDEAIRKRIERNTLHFSTWLHPNVVLAPTTQFLQRLEAQAGIQLQKNKITVELGTKFMLVNPLRGGDLQANPYLWVQVRGKETQLDLGVDYEEKHQSVKAYLAYHF